MKISAEGLKQFIEAYEEEFKEKIDPDEAEHMMFCLLHVMRELSQSLPHEASPDDSEEVH